MSSGSLLQHFKRLGLGHTDQRDSISGPACALAGLCDPLFNEVQVFSDQGYRSFLSFRFFHSAPSAGSAFMILNDLPLQGLLLLDVIVHLDGIRVENNIVVLLQSVQRVGLYDRILFILVEDVDLPEIGISLVDIVDPDQLILLFQCKLL